MKFSNYMLGRTDEALELEHRLYQTHLKRDPRLAELDTIFAGSNLVGSLVNVKRYAEASSPTQGVPWRKPGA